MTTENQPTWIPYEPTRDCSLGRCSIYCPQWCYIYFTPPPPPLFTDDNSSSSPTFSPLVIALIGILVSALLLISYYTIISKYCSVLDLIRHCLGRSGSRDRVIGQSHRLEEWQAFPSDGLDEYLISKIVVCKYKKGDGFVDSTDCAVCLSEFRDDESLRLLPNCSHAFHIQCIDTWLKSHSNCPLCRANIMPVNLAPPATSQPLPTSSSDAYNSTLAIAVDDPSECAELVADRHDNSDGSVQDNQLRNKAERRKEESSSVNEVANAKDCDNIHQIRRSLSMDSLRWRKVSIGDVLQMSMEDELMTAKEKGLWVRTSSSVRDFEEDSKNNSRTRTLHSVINPVSMKRSTSLNGRLSLNRHGRGKNAVLPL